MTEAEHEAAAQAIVRKVAEAINDGKVFPTDFARRIASAQAASVLTALTPEDLTIYRDWIKRPFPTSRPLAG